MAILQKLDILSLGRLKTEAVQVDGGDEIIISEMGAADSFKIMTDPQYQDDKGYYVMSRYVPALLARCIVNAEGDRLFTDEDENTVARFAPRLIDTLATVALRLNRMSITSTDETTKNSTPSPD